ncbi:MAG TPA: type IV toxin-antitoxin system AbiEi family antitoxin [Acidimicrobiales bacterium]|nr:type IV toxin-antitoxin system AbiEi family antitoxin [Acidimicrobiales bacterium]
MDRSVAAIVEGLELEQPTVVTDALLARLSDHAGSPLSSDAAAERLVRAGWLLPLRTRRAWEFVPAARAGRYGSGDPLIELRALLAHRPGAPVAAAFDSAVWALGYSTHQPATEVIAHRQGWRAPEALSDFRSITYEWRLPTWEHRGVPTWSPATVVVAVADRPRAQGNWANADDWLPETMRAATPDDVWTEATGRPLSTLARLGHLAEWSGRRDIAARIEPALPERLPVSYLGPRTQDGEWVNRWRLYDSLLPPR